MCFIIFFGSLIGICCICYIIMNYCYIDEGKKYKGNLQIILNKENVDYEERKDIIDKIMCGDYDKISDIVDNIRIN